MSTQTDCQVAVIGGGLVGAATALALQKLGLRVILVELIPRPHPPMLGIRAFMRLAPQAKIYCASWGLGSAWTPRGYKLFTAWMCTVMRKAISDLMPMSRGWHGWPPFWRAVACSKRCGKRYASKTTARCAARSRIRKQRTNPHYGARASWSSVKVRRNRKKGGAQ